MCEYSTFQIESNSYLLFDSKLTQLFKIFQYLFNCSILCDQPGDWDVICLYFASHKPLHSPVIHWSQYCAECVCLPLPLPWLPYAGANLDHDTWLYYNGGRQTQCTVSWALDFLSVLFVMDSTLTRRHAAFKFHGDTGPANVILSLSLAHAAHCLGTAHIRKATSAQL